MKIIKIGISKNLSKMSIICIETKRSHKQVVETNQLMYYPRSIVERLRISFSD